MEKKRVIISVRLERFDIKILQSMGYLDGRGRVIKNKPVSKIFKHLLRERFGTDDAFQKAIRYHIGQENMRIIKSRKKIKDYAQQLENLKQIQGVDKNGIQSIQQRTKPESSSEGRT